MSHPPAFYGKAIIQLAIEAAKCTDHLKNNRLTTKPFHEFVSPLPR